MSDQPLSTADRPVETGNTLVFLKRPPVLDLDSKTFLRTIFPDAPDNVSEDAIDLGEGRFLARVPRPVSAIGIGQLHAFGYDAANPFMLYEPERNLYLDPPPRNQIELERPEETELTWGLKRIGIRNGKQPTGKGAIVAVLDTGIDRNHPDFAGRIPCSDVQSFIGGTIDDSHGHGTHCAGIIAGRRHPSQGPRYSVAPDARLLIAKISTDGHCFEYKLDEALMWAAKNGAHIASLSMGTQITEACKEPSSVMNEFAKLLLDEYNLVIFAATGNANERPQEPLFPIHHPANCPEIVAVAAVDEDEKVAPFSCGRICGTERAPSVAAPGVSIRSSIPTIESPLSPYVSLHGTSQATPYAAGVAALLVEAYGLRGRDLIGKLEATTKALSGKADDIGQGLVQAP